MIRTIKHHSKWLHVLGVGLVGLSLAATLVLYGTSRHPASQRHNAVVLASDTVDNLAQATSPSTSTQAQLATVLNIKELKFTINLPDGLNDLKYIVDASVPGITIANFTTASLEQVDGPTSLCTATDHPLGSIVLYTEDPKSIGAHVAATRVLGKSYLAFMAPQQGCSRDSATVSLQTAQSKLLRQAFDKAISENQQ